MRIYCGTSPFMTRRRQKFCEKLTWDLHLCFPATLRFFLLVTVFYVPSDCLCMWRMWEVLALIKQLVKQEDSCDFTVLEELIGFGWSEK